MAELRRRQRGNAVGRDPQVQPRGREAVEEEKVKGSYDSPAAVAKALVAPWIALVVARGSAALYTAISDCDETFNYWEPAHFLAFGYGFQTWEYSPAYALRSYLFLLPHAAVARVAAAICGRPAAFFVTRGVQAAAAVLAECCFTVAIAKRFGCAVASDCAWLLVVSPGTFIAAVSFLPSSVAMLQVCLVWALWLARWQCAAIFVGAGTCIVVWPFACLLFVPLGLHSLWTRPASALTTALASFAFWAAASFAVDSAFYGRPVLPALEIVRYNVLDRSTKGGAELYGVEPWHFYLANGLLNLTIALPAALALPAVAILCLLIDGGAHARRQTLEVLWFTLVGFLWLAFFSSIPHKEERFLAPVYPLLLLAAAGSARGVSVLAPALARRVLPAFLKNPCARLLSLTSCVFLILTATVSLSRIGALQTGYTAPVTIYSTLSSQLQALRVERAGEVQSLRAERSGQPGGADAIHTCIGGEWYRYMTSFFLPDHQDHLSYVRFGPTGLLPAEFNATLGTSGVPPHMNDRNLEEPSRYIDPAHCSFFVDLDVGSGQGDVPALRERPLKFMAEVQFLDASRSRFPWRAFHVPGVSLKRNAYASYRLLAFAPG